ncbi:hypothetical protein D3C86_1131430 [compost metagenome]
MHRFRCRDQVQHQLVLDAGGQGRHIADHAEALEHQPGFGNQLDATTPVVDGGGQTLAALHHCAGPVGKLGAKLGKAAISRHVRQLLVHPAQLVFEVIQRTGLGDLVLGLP